MSKGLCKHPRMNENSQQMLQAPGGIAQVVASLQAIQPAPWPCKSRFRYRLSTDHQMGNQPPQQPEVELGEALRIKSAEFWLKLGEVEQAILEIRTVPEPLQKHPSVVRLRLAIVRATSQSQDREI